MSSDLTFITNELGKSIRDPEADTTAWEQEVDHLVYKLYDLMPEEIKLVEEGGQSGPCGNWTRERLRRG